MNDDILSLLDRAITDVEPLLASMTPSDHPRPTPCGDFDLGTLTAHLVGGMRSFADVGEGRPMRFDTDPDITAVSIADEYRRAADRLLTAFRQPGMLDRTLPMPWGATPVTQLLGFELLEVVAHGWDISRALGGPFPVANDLVEAALDGALQWVDDSVRTPQMFGPEVPVPANAPAIDRLVGLLGRRPDWAPPEAGG